MIYNSQQGISLYLAILFLGIILTMVLGISTILIGEIKIVRGLGDSVIAFYAADTGIEEILTVREESPPTTICVEASPCSLDNEAEYYIIITATGLGGCTADNYCIKSIGSYKETRRAIEITY